MSTRKRATEEDIFDLQIGLGESSISIEEQYFFDIAGYLVLDDFLTPEQVAQARQMLAGRAAPEQLELLNIIKEGGALEDAMALPRTMDLVQAFIWGQQYRLVGSRALFRAPGARSRLSRGGASDPRRYARYRCFADGQFRCLMITCLIALSDVVAGDGAFCAIPGSHKVNLPHPYEDVDLDQIPPLRTLELRAGSGVLFTESLSHGFKTPAGQTHFWLAYQYGPSYMVDWPGCEPAAELLERTAGDPVKSHLLLRPYYHPAGSQNKKKRM